MKQVEERYEASKMAYRDIKNSIDTAKREGRIEANIETAQRLLAMGLPTEQVAKATQLPLDRGSKSELLIKAKTNAFLLCWIPQQITPTYFLKRVGVFLFQYKI